jgi:hypothetical protein
VGILEESLNYTVEEFQKYIEALEFIQNQQNFGVAIRDNETELKFYIVE